MTEPTSESLIDGLPKVKDLLDLLMKCNNDKITKDQLVTLKDDFLKISNEVVVSYREYTKISLTCSYQELMMGLTEFDFTVGALVGVGKAVSERLYGKVYEESTNATLSTSTDEKTKKKLSQGDREKFADFEIAVIDGMVELLKRTDGNIKSRTFAFKEEKY